MLIGSVPFSYGEAEKGIPWIWLVNQEQATYASQTKKKITLSPFGMLNFANLCIKHAGAPK
jgi:hypothetical protein